MVIENHPLLDDGTPFPTTFWLTCPVLVKRIGELESRGRMAALTDRLQEDAPLARRFAAALQRYRDRRDGHAFIEDSGAPPGGGPERVKCLHAHVAHELADPPNPIGAIALAQTEWPDCRSPCLSLKGGA
ncbi:MAG: DUF501 domain-containing protein [Actinomycetota bacterium]|nr:DUF501 domain-containing protein [Actinomycetota bacterium]